MRPFDQSRIEQLRRSLAAAGLPRTEVELLLQECRRLLDLRDGVSLAMAELAPVFREVRQRLQRINELLEEYRAFPPE